MNPAGFRSDAVLNVGDVPCRRSVTRHHKTSEGLAEATSILEVDSLSVRFGQSDVLNNLAFTVAEKSVVAIIGPNGAGKTVLLRALLGSDPVAGERSLGAGHTHWLRSTEARPGARRADDWT